MGALPLAKMMTPLLLLMAFACGDSQSAEPAPVAEGHPWIAEEDFDPGNFHRSTTIDNRWFPLVPGTRFTWKGQATVDGKRVSRAVVLTVTDLTKTIDGVRTLVVDRLSVAVATLPSNRRVDAAGRQRRGAVHPDPDAGAV